MRINKDFLYAGILALLLSFVLFGNGIGGDFVFDDKIAVVGNPLIGSSVNLPEIFTTPYFAYQPLPGLYRPLAIASYSINASIFGVSPVSFHAVNIILHALTSLLIFIFFYRLSGRITAFSGFIFFMFLPIHVEDVTSIVGRAEILSLLFMTAALLFVLDRKYVLSAAAFLLSLFSKEMALSFVPIFVCLEYIWHKKKIKLILKDSVYPVIALLLYSILRYAALGKYFLRNDATPVYNPIKFAPFFEGLWTSFKVFYLYIEKIFFPVSLSIDYSFNQIPLVKNPFHSIEALLGILILAGLIFSFFKIKSVLFRTGILIFLSSYFVISNWVFKTGTIMAERLMYAPTFGLALLAGMAFNHLYPKFKNKKLLYGLAIIVLGFYGFIIVDRNKDWLKEESLFKSAYAVAPNSIINQTNMAYLDFISGDFQSAGTRLDKVLELAPDHVAALNLAGQNYKKLGQYQKAEESWKRAIELRGDYLRAYLSLGILYYENSYNKSAEFVLSKAVEIYPRWHEIFVLALTKINLDKSDEASALIEKYFGKNPPRRELKLALGIAYLRKGDRNTAVVYFNDSKNPKISMDDFLKMAEQTKIFKIED